MDSKAAGLDRICGSLAEEVSARGLRRFGGNTATSQRKGCGRLSFGPHSPAGGALEPSVITSHPAGVPWCWSFLPQPATFCRARQALYFHFSASCYLKLQVNARLNDSYFIFIKFSLELRPAPIKLFRLLAGFKTQRADQNQSEGRELL